MVNCFVADGHGNEREVRVERRSRAVETRETRHDSEAPQNPGERFLAYALEQARRQREHGEPSHDKAVQQLQERLQRRRQEREAGEHSSTGKESLLELEKKYIAGIDDPKRRERFVNRLERAKQGWERLERIIESAPPDVQYVLLSESGAEVRAVFAGVKPASFGGIASVLHVHLESQYDPSSSEEERRLLIADIAGLSRKVGKYLVEHDPAHDVRLIDPYPRSLYNPLPGAPFLADQGYTLYSSGSTHELFQGHPDVLGRTVSDAAIEATIYRTSSPESKWKERDRELLTQQKGLLCGIPYDAVIWRSRFPGSPGESSGRDLTGLLFGCESREEKSIKEYIEDYKAICRFSGINEIHSSLFAEHVDDENPFSTFHVMRELIENDATNPFSNASALRGELSGSSSDSDGGSKRPVKGRLENPFSDESDSSEDN